MDITDRHQAERAREDIERLMRHDLRTPLNVIINIPRLLRDDGNLTGEQRELLDELERAGQNMLDMIDVSLRLNQLERGGYVPLGQALDLVTLIEDVISDVQHAFAFKRIDSQLWHQGKQHLEGAPCPLLGEPLMYYNLFANLMKNAFEASPVGACVNIVIESRADYVQVELHNQGCIPEEIRERLFEKYVTAGKSSGTGLGTYSARLIAEAVGGQIDFTSSEEDGTRMRVQLPLDSCHAPAALSPTPGKDER